MGDRQSWLKVPTQSTISGFRAPIRHNSKLPKLLSLGRHLSQRSLLSGTSNSGRRHCLRIFLLGMSAKAVLYAISSLPQVPPEPCSQWAVHGSPSLGYSYSNERVKRARCTGSSLDSVPARNVISGDNVLQDLVQRMPCRFHALYSEETAQEPCSPI